MVKQHETSHNSEITVMLHSAGASSLSTVAQSDDNNINEFYTLIGEDVKLLEYTDKLPFINTPLHIVASYGNMQYKSLLVYSFTRLVLYSLLLAFWYYLLKLISLDARLSMIYVKRFLLMKI